MKVEWIAYTPDGTTTVFKRYTALYNSMTYINVKQSQAAVTMVQTVQNDFEGCKKK